MTTLALDLSATTGFALSAAGVITHGSKPFPKVMDQEHPGLRYIRFQRWLRDRIALDKPKRIAVEKAGYFRSLPAQDICVGFRGILLSTAAYYDIPLIQVTNSRLKKWASGKGNARKEEMLKAARARWPKERFTDDNACDAFLLLQYTIETFGP